MKSSIRLFRIAGIDIGIHYTWFFIVLLVTWSLAQGYFPQLYPNWNTLSYWIMGALTAIMLFVSVLIHEMAHSLVARAKGMSVNSITLFLFGGVSNLQEEPKQPGAEFVMAIVGPLTSLVLAGIFWSLSKISNPQSMAGALVGYLTLINLILAIFNLLPGFPLDGGRVLRSIIWAATGSLTKATNAAALAGLFLGWGLITYGVLQALSGNLGGLWTAFIGWFLNNAADVNRREVTLREHFSNIKVKEVMGTNGETIAPNTSVEQAVTGILHRKYDRAVPVCQNSRLLGIITMTDIKELPKDKWATTPVEQIMTRSPLYTVTAEDTVDTVLKLLMEHDINQVIISEQGQCSGILKRADIINYLHLSNELGGTRKR
ncbi:MAG: site-2 protease family protein [Chloroflexi bacterium]|nr:site-2 protease family protein [Chloroflexota bacterium]